jgi:hypothetical protein
VLDLLGEPHDAQCIGRSLLPLITQDATPPQNVFLEWAPNRTKVRKGTKLAHDAWSSGPSRNPPDDCYPRWWKLCLRDKDLNELYNLNDDPLERRNLYADRQFGSVIARLTGEIRRWQEATNDKVKL